MGGLSIPALAAPAIVGAGTLLVYAAEESAVLETASGLAVPFRPPQWAQPAMTMLTIPAQYVQSNPPQQVAAPVYNGQGAQISAPITSAPANAVPSYLVFDGVMNISHSQPMVATEHPVQNSANLSDHIRAQQAVITMDVLMTDVLPAYAAGQWVGNSSKSVACFQTLDNLRLNRIPLTVTTRLKTYYPCFIMNVSPDETVKTRYGFRGRIEFKQLNLFSVQTQNVSARNQTTGATVQGQVNPTAVPAGVTSQNGVANASTIQGSTGTVIGAGTFGSNNNGSIIPGVN